VHDWCSSHDLDSEALRRGLDGSLVGSLTAGAAAARFGYIRLPDPELIYARD